MTSPDTRDTPNGLRSRAETLTGSCPPNDLPDMDDAATLRLLHELQVHRVELELQNETLRQSQDETRQAMQQLAELNTQLEARVAARTTELLVAKQSAEAANYAKSAFLANMSHEIRTPMNGVIGMINLLRQDGVSPAQAEKLDKIEAATEHLLGVINDILDLSKIEAGKFIFEEQPVSVCGVMSNLQAILGTRAAAKGLQLEFHAAPCPLGLLGDPTRLQQALLNYVGNALKFTSRGSVTVHSFIAEQDDVSVLMRFEVRDTGIGIPEDVQPRLFHAFEQGDNSITRQFGGTGLGLTITRKLAEQMGGETGVDSRPGEGSCFWLTARLKKLLHPAALASTEPRQVQDAERQIKARHSGRRILVVDDDELNREVAKMQLETVELVPDSAVNGQQAVDMARDFPYAAILMDMQMPILDGLAATRQIRALPGYDQTPILAMTANAYAEDRASCLAAGMDDFIGKPFNPATLFASLLMWLEKERNPG